MTTSGPVRIKIIAILRFGRSCYINILVKPLPVYIGEAPGRPLHDVVLGLNKRPKGRFGRFDEEAHGNLVQLIQAWQDSAQKWEDSVSHWRASGASQASIPRPPRLRYPPGCPTLFEMNKRCRVLFTASGDQRRWHFGIVYEGERGKAWTAWDFACQEFIRLVTDPECNRFGGPCPLCGDYFIRRTAKSKRFCTTKCAATSSALACAKKNRRLAHTARLALAQTAIKEWSSAPRRQGWKEWVSDKQLISKNWLTRAVNRGELEPPLGPRTTASRWETRSDTF
jgi:hypothetical protein